MDLHIGMALTWTFLRSSVVNSTSRNYTTYTHYIIFQFNSVNFFHNFLLMVKDIPLFVVYDIYRLSQIFNSSSIGIRFKESESFLAIDSNKIQS